MARRRLSAIALALVAAGAGGCSKSSNTQTASSAGQAAATTYVANCASCHQPDGKGLAGTFPPLAGNAIVTGDPATVIHIVKYGLSGSVVVAGKTYDGMMPAWSPQLSDGDIATTISYIRSSWGNSASAVTAAQVSAVSK